MELSRELREVTNALHRRAERTGVVGALLRGTATRAGYVLLLRNLLAAYRALETALEDRPSLAALAPRALLRSAALEHDLRALEGANFEQDVALLDAGARYAGRIAEVGREQPLRLVAHAYTRYLGDLSGGAIVGRLLARTLFLGEDCLAFYRFPGIPHPAEFKHRYRAALDAMPLSPGERRAVLEEAAIAFRHNIELSTAVQAALSPVDARRSGAELSS